MRKARDTRWHGSILLFTRRRIRRRSLPDFGLSPRRRCATPLARPIVDAWLAQDARHRAVLDAVKDEIAKLRAAR